MSLAALALVASRFLHFLATAVLFGAGLFPYYGIAAPPNKRRMPVWLPRLLFAAAVLALASGLAWFMFTAAGMSDALGGAVDPATLGLVLRETAFGRVWLWRLVLAAILVVLLLGRQVQAWRYSAVLVGAGLLLASIALTGHAGSNATAAGLRHRVADAVHLVTAGIWLGALAVLSVMAWQSARQVRDADMQALRHGLMRFSFIGPGVVALLVLSGLINPGFLSGFGTLYGQVLLAKIGLFVAMLGLAVAHRYWLTPKLAAAMSFGRGKADAARVLRKSLIGESVLALLLLCAVAWLGTLSPGGE